MIVKTPEHQLINFVYQAASDQSCWPLCLAVVSDVSSSNQTHNSLRDYKSVRDKAMLKTEDNRAEGELMSYLSEHFIQAKQIINQCLKLEKEKRLAEKIFDEVPVAVMIVDGAREVKIMNRRARAFLNGRNDIIADQGVLELSRKDSNARLGGYLYDAVRANRFFVKSLALPSSERKPGATVLITSYRLDGSNEQEEAFAAVFISTFSEKNSVNCEILSSLYQLTPTEAEVARLVTFGRCVEDIAQLHDVTPATVRAQLRSIFSKTGVSRQAELVKELLTSPAAYVYSQEARALQTLPQRPKPISTAREGIAYLPDGRRMSYAEYGPADGYPVIYCHGIFGSRLERPGQLAYLESQRIRFIVPERPGFGDSDCCSHRTRLSWTDDLGYLMEVLGVTRQFSVIGFSNGAGYAAACAYRWPKRVDKLALVAGLSPVNGPADLDGLDKVNRLLAGLAFYMPNVFRRLSMNRIRSVVINPSQLFNRQVDFVGKSDQRVLGNGDIREVLESSLKLSAKRCSDGIVSDIIVLLQPWGFSLEAITTPTDVWHGFDDRHVPVRMAQCLAEAIPNAKKRFFPQDGHYIMYSQWPSIVSSFKKDQ